MNEFVKSLNNAVEKTHLSKNEIIRLAQINRSTFFQFLNGKRIPTDEQMRQLYRVLQLSEKERNDLIDGYDRLKIGEAVWSNRRQVQGCIQTVRMNEITAPYLNHSPVCEFAVNLTSGYVSSSESVFYNLRMILNREIMNNQPEIDVFLPIAGKFLLDYMAYLYQDHKGKTIYLRHLNQFGRNNSDRQDGILEYFKTILMFVTSRCAGYEAYYYYDDSILESSMGIMFPYYIITSDMLAFISADMTEMLQITDPKTISVWKTTFENRLKYAHKLLSDYSGSRCYEELSTLWSTGQNYYSYGSFPSLPPYINPAIVTRYVPPAVQSLVIDKVMYLNQKRREYAFSTADGLYEFARTGIMRAYPRELVAPLLPEDRKNILIAMRESMTSEGSNDFLINEKLCAVPQQWEICVAENERLVLYEEHIPGNQIYTIDEKIIVNSFADYFESLKSTECVMSRREVAQILDNVISSISD